MFHAFSDRENIWIRSLQVVVHNDAAVDLQARLAPELHIGANSGSNNHKICLHAAAILECHPLGFSIPKNRRGIALHKHFYAEAFHFRFEVAAADKIELALHQCVHQVDNRYIAALHLQPASRFEPQQTSADHHCFFAWRRAIQQSARVVQIAKNEHTLFFHSVHRRDQRRASRSDQQFVERC